MESFCGAQVPRISTDSALLEDFAEELDGFVSPATLDEELTFTLDEELTALDEELPLGIVEDDETISLELDEIVEDDDSITTDSIPETALKSVSSHATIPKTSKLAARVKNFNFFIDSVSLTQVKLKIPIPSFDCI